MVDSSHCSLLVYQCKDSLDSLSQSIAAATMNPKVSISMSTSSMESFNQRASQKRLLHSDSSVSYQVNHPTSFREDSIKEIISRSVALMNDEDIETTTSRSFVHGLILIMIMVSSLIAFICSKVRRCSNYSDLSNYEECSKYFSLYSWTTICSCIVTFFIYFLHLIGQCDVLCLTRKKYEFEIMAIAIMCSCQSIASVCYVAHTYIFSESFTLTSLILSAIVVTLYLLRIIILAYEMVSQRTKRSKQNSQRVRDIILTRRSISKDQSSLVCAENTLPVTKVISYVRNAQRKKTLSTSVSEDYEDEVFIQ